QRTYTINDDPPVVTAIAHYEGGAEGTATFGTSPVKFKVTRTGGDTTTPIDVGYSLSGTAKSGDDYTDTHGGTIGVKDSAILEVDVVNDKELDPSETVIATILGSGSYKLPDPLVPPSATGTIQDNERAGVKVISGTTINHSDTEHNYSGWNSTLTYDFNGTSDDGLGEAVIRLRVSAQGYGTNSGPDEAFIGGPNGTHFVELKFTAIQVDDPTSANGKRWRIVDNVTPHAPTAQDGNLTVGLDADITYSNNDLSARIDVIFAAQYTETGAGITGISAGPAGVEWATDPDRLDEALRASWNVTWTVITM
ncbi:MAG TPA: hypothetical protein VK324_09960, partial [Tepidisphaeraceae bacterium]|nr:hypothetical protein [Tepidisphaeraceae bacterium]